MASWVCRIGLLLAAWVVTACNGSGGDAPSDASPAGAGATQSPLLVGRFKDSYVQGLNYSTPSLTGVTDPQGAFNYRAGETVTFSIGDMVLGRAQAAPLMTPVDIVPGATGIDDQTVLNLGRLLQSLDADGDPDNGITIDEPMRAQLQQAVQAAGSPVELDSPAMGNSAAVAQLFGQLNRSAVAGRRWQLVSAERARQHLDQSLNGQPPAAAAEPARDSRIVDAPVFRSAAVALDSQGRAHVVAGGDHLYHFVRTGGGWQAGSAPGFGSSTASVGRLFIDEQDALHLFYFDSTGHLWYASNRSGTWTQETLVALDAVVDRKGQLHVLRYDRPSHRLRYGRAVAGVWQWDSFDAGRTQIGPIAPISVGGGGALPPPPEVGAVVARLEVDGSGAAHVVWRVHAKPPDSGLAVYYASNAAGAWRPDFLAQQFDVIVDRLDLVVDQAGRAHVAFGYTPVTHGVVLCNGGCPPAGLIQFFVRQDDAWQRPADDAQNPWAADGRRFAQEPATGTWHAAWVEDGKVLHAVQSGADSATETVAAKPLPAGRFADMVMDSRGVHHLSYWNEARQAVEYANDASGNWVIETAAAGVSLDQSTNLAVYPTGEVGIVFVNITGFRELRYLRRTSSGWSSLALDFAGLSRPSLSVDERGHSHVLYLGQGLVAPLMYAADASGIWVSRRVAELPSSGSKARLSTYGDGILRACISVGQFLPNNYPASGLGPGLWLAALDSEGASWQFENLHNALPTSDCVIRADARQLSLAYLRGPSTAFSNTNELVVVTQKAPARETAVLATGILNGLAMTLDPRSARPVISFVNGGNGSTDFAHQDGSGTWLAQTLAPFITFFEPDFQAALAVDAAGVLSAAYFQPESLDLVLTQRALP